MNPYTLDFADPVQPTRPSRPTRKPRYRMYRTFRQMRRLLGGLVCSMALVGWLWQRTQIQSVRRQLDTQTVQYDSLLAAKAENDRQLERLRNQLIQYHLP